ncbi:MurR/RpiR family transcriptional regulator [Clostridium gasigenes]|uniref:Transcriptional regulator, RpiR family n=1 Tax=Clostridium gasigenes TaxID=94869 RepID=A0A1H0URH6_9CLOT|nr:MurR/RpiR family transcriptional regulator [Clostridium gasigenes]MBB6624413.1 MurR/RpiR family transcriptional regulator [Clostridium gasigenes]MBU3088692.1 MurR/RpiR family transcriptional regulator [Clostridium gasigenes]MBU3132231.1 MurR/RpiR family transcriptional regulator [Clostridium gasigenes]NKF06871.1 MurR/RpiR family transcriptional regulator [Clostridium gasigenes]QSW19860.1 MurR/RpiR family transcriptional regulator [Clostridium gasigenes]
MRIDELINAHYDKLNQNDLHIWKYIYSNKKECCGLTIDDLAGKCNVSRTTILRFAQKLSLKGYSELKVYLKWEMTEEIIDENFVEIVCNEFKSSIDEMKKRDYSKVCEMIYESRRVFIYGTGAVQKSVAQEVKRIFLSGKECFAVIDGIAEIDLTLDTMTSNDLMIVISLSGESSHIRGFAKQLSIRNIPFISVTKLKNNELAKLSKESLYINTSVVNIGNSVEYEAVNLFFILVEILFLKYIMYKNNRKLEEVNKL